MENKETRYILESDGSQACTVAERILKENNIPFVVAYRGRGSVEGARYPVLEIRGDRPNLLPNLVSISNHFWKPKDEADLKKI